MSLTGRMFTAIVVAGFLVALAAPIGVAAAQALPAPASPASAPARPSFQAPSDGKLTAEQVKMYIAVRRLAPTLSRPEENATDPLAQITRLISGLNSETTAATQLGADIEEYRWVSLQISAAAERPAGAAPVLGDEILKALLTASGKAREALGSAVTDSGAAGGGAPAPSAAVVYNRELLSKFKPELDALATR